MSHLRNIVGAIEDKGYSVVSIGYEENRVKILVEDPAWAGNRAFLENAAKQEDRGNPWKKGQTVYNPWAEESANLTEQARIITTRPELVIFYRLSASLGEYISQQILQREDTNQRQDLSSVLKLARELVQKFPEPSP
jgi:hypothetical protein